MKCNICVVMSQVTHHNLSILRVVMAYCYYKNLIIFTSVYDQFFGNARTPTGIGQVKSIIFLRLYYFDYVCSA